MPKVTSSMASQALRPMSTTSPKSALLHGKELHVVADAGYQGIEKRQEVQPHEVQWHIAMRPGQRRRLDQSRNPMDALTGQLEHIKASIRARVEHAFRIIKCQFGYTKVRYRGVAKNTAQITTLFALGNLWMARKHLLANKALVRQ